MVHFITVPSPASFQFAEGAEAPARWSPILFKRPKRTDLVPKPIPFNFGRSKIILAPVDIRFENSNLELDLSLADYSEYDRERGTDLPKRITPQLAEEIGMHLGDGFLSRQSNIYRLKGSYLDEREFYQDFVRPLYKEIFNLEVEVRDYRTSYGFEIASKALWTFKTKVLKIPAGRKTTIRVPEVIKVKNQEVLAGFLRGYFDTDGCLSFISQYGYRSYYPVISAASISEFLIKDVADILSMFGLRPRISYNRECWSVWLSGYANFFRFKELIGWNSKKYVDKISAWKTRYPDLARGASGEVVITRACGAQSAESLSPEFDSRLAPSSGEIA